MATTVTRDKEAGTVRIDTESAEMAALGAAALFFIRSTAAHASAVAEIVGCEEIEAHLYADLLGNVATGVRECRDREVAAARETEAPIDGEGEIASS
jgi:hypothetical protein